VSGGDDSATYAGHVARAQDLALRYRYRCEFVDLHKFTVQPYVFEKVPVNLTLRYNFVRIGVTQDERIAIAVEGPKQLMLIDEISLLLGKTDHHSSRHSGSDHWDPKHR
jgi:hypothetical protein